MPKPLPSPDLLPMLVACGHYLSFTAAAAKPGMTQPAVSRHVQPLDQALAVWGTALDGKGVAIGWHHQMLTQRKRRPVVCREFAQWLQTALLGDQGPTADCVHG